MRNKTNINSMIKQVSDEKITWISSMLEDKFGIRNITAISSSGGYELYVYNNEGKITCFQSYIMEELAMISALEEALRLRNEYVCWYEF